MIFDMQRLLKKATTSRYNSPNMIVSLRKMQRNHAWLVKTLHREAVDFVQTHGTATGVRRILSPVWWKTESGKSLDPSCSSDPVGRNRKGFCSSMLPFEVRKTGLPNATRPRWAHHQGALWLQRCRVRGANSREPVSPVFLRAEGIFNRAAVRLFQHDPFPKAVSGGGPCRHQ